MVNIVHVFKFLRSWWKGMPRLQFMNDIIPRLYKVHFNQGFRDMLIMHREIPFLLRSVLVWLKLKIFATIIFLQTRVVRCVFIGVQFLSNFCHF